MSQFDCRGDPITGATPRSLTLYEQAAADFRSWRGDPAQGADAAAAAAPDFVMAHVLHAHVLVCTRDCVSIAAAAPIHARAAALRANDRERAHLAAIAAVLHDDRERAKRILTELLARYPRDLLALQVVHALDYLTGDVALFDRRIAQVSPAWTPDVPGYHALLAMHAFGLIERGDCVRARGLALQALALEPRDARACHTMAHVFETERRPEEGLRWMHEHRKAWDGDTLVASHCWWHLALLHLQRGDAQRALGIYDGHMRGRTAAQLAGLIDASALLWRAGLAGADAGDRWNEVVAGWTPRIAERSFAFSDVHAVMAFVGARRLDLAERLVRARRAAAGPGGRLVAAVRRAGLRACRALLAFGHRDFARVVRAFLRLRPLLPRLGGSRAQRDVIALTVCAAIVALRARWRRLGARA